MAAQGASLQNYNNQLVAHLEALKEKRVEVEIQIQEEMKEKSKIERQIALLTDKLTLVNQSLQKKLESRENYNRTIQETEGAYMKILESSQTLLHVMKRESMNLAKKLNK